MAGNEPPRVAFTAPADGGFFEWSQPVVWKLEASDAEDGVLPPESVLVQMETRNRAASDDAVAPPGLALMRRTTCFACHSAREKSAGPPYSTIAARYASEAGARDRLAAKVRPVLRVDRFDEGVEGPDQRKADLCLAEKLTL